MQISEVSFAWSLKVKKSSVGVCMIEIKYALQKASQNDQKTQNFEYKVLEKPVNSNIRRRSVRNFEYTELR
jgi:hypothetical protein